MRYQQNYNQPFGYPQDQMMPAPQQALPQSAEPPAYGPESDVIDTYGSIIKDLTDTEKMLDSFELRLRGRMRNKNDDIVNDPAQKALVKTDEAAREFVNLVRSMVNRHNDFSFYTDKEGYDIIEGAAKIIPEWLMFQGEDVPKGYRQKVGFEAMAMIKASVHKAINGRMLTWSKGAIMEQSQLQPKQDKKGLMDYIFPWKNKGG